MDVDQWRRERRLDAYAELARATHDLGEATALRIGADAQQIEDARKGFDRAVYEVQRAAGRVILIAPPSVGLFANAVNRESAFVPYSAPVPRRCWIGKTVKGCEIARKGPREVRGIHVGG